MSSAEIPDDPTDRRVDPSVTRLDRVREAAIEAELASGVREETTEAARRNIFLRIGIVAAGLVVTAVGVVLLVLPGPGMIVVFLGLLLLASEVPFAARWLEKVRERIPQDENGKIPRRSIVYIAAVCTVTLTFTTSFSVWWSFFKT